MQGRGAQPWPKWGRDQLPTSWPAHPHLKRCHHVLLCLCHVVHKGCLWDHVQRHHVAAGVLRRVCGAICDATPLQKSDVQHREWDPFQHPGLPCSCLTPPGHVHWPGMGRNAEHSSSNSSKIIWALFFFLSGGSAKRERNKGIHRKPPAETRTGGLQMSQVLQH